MTALQAGGGEGEKGALVHSPGIFDFRKENRKRRSNAMRPPPRIKILTLSLIELDSSSHSFPHLLGMLAKKALTVKSHKKSIFSACGLRWQNFNEMPVQ